MGRDDFGVIEGVMARLAAQRSAAIDAEIANIMGFASKPRPGTDWVLIGPTTVIHESPKAVKVHVEGTPLWMDEWVPKSQLHKTENECNALGDVGMLIIPEWLAKEKGWLK